MDGRATAVGVHLGEGPARGSVRGGGVFRVVRFEGVRRKTRWRP